MHHARQQMGQQMIQSFENFAPPDCGPGFRMLYTIESP